MPENKNKLNTASFDPGFAAHIIHFYPAYMTMEEELSRLKNFGQKKMRYKVLDKTVQKAMQSTLGFWVGCVLWGGYIKYKFQAAPKTIEDNSFLGLSKDDVASFGYMDEFKVMAKYLENFEKNTKYYTGTNAALPKEYKTILEEYESFIELNNHFLETKTTADLKIPAKFDFLAKYSDTQIKKLGVKIIEIIETGDLSSFLELDLIKQL